MNQPHEKAPPILSDLVEVLTEALIEERIPADQARQASLVAVDHMRETWGGDRFYMPKGLSLVLSKRDREIYRKFNGANHFSLAKEFGLTVRQIQNIIAKIRDEDFARSQPGLPGFLGDD